MSSADTLICPPLRTLKSRSHGAVTVRRRALAAVQPCSYSLVSKIVSDPFYLRRIRRARIWLQETVPELLYKLRLARFFGVKILAAGVLVFLGR